MRAIGGIRGDKVLSSFWCSANTKSVLGKRGTLPSKWLCDATKTLIMIEKALRKSHMMEEIFETVSKNKLREALDTSRTIVSLC